MTQEINYSLCKCKNPSSHSQVPHEKLIVLAGVSNPSNTRDIGVGQGNKGGRDRDRQIHRTHHPISLDKQKSSWLGEESLSQKVG